MMIRVKELKPRCLTLPLWKFNSLCGPQGSKQRTSHTFWNPADNWT